MNLIDYVERYALTKTLCRKYVSGLRTTARKLTNRFPDCTLELLADRLNPHNGYSDSINGWLEELERASSHNAWNKRKHLRTLWLAANEEGLAPPLGKLRRIKVRRSVPIGLTLDELALLLKAADGLIGTFHLTNTCRRMYWRSLLLAGWDTALRISDLRAIERDWIWPGGYIVIVQHKTGHSHRARFRPETVEAIDLLVGGRKTGLIWDTLSHKNFYDNLRKLASTAGVKSNFKMIRSGSISYVERDNPGMGWKHAGHTRPGITEIHYNDPRIVQREPTQPPSPMILPEPPQE